MTDQTNTNQENTDEPEGPYAIYSADPKVARKLAVEAIVRAKHPEYFKALEGGELQLQGVHHPMCLPPTHAKWYRQVAQTGQEAEIGNQAKLIVDLGKAITDHEAKWVKVKRWIGRAVGVWVLVGLIVLAFLTMMQ